MWREGDERGVGGSLLVFVISLFLDRSFSPLSSTSKTTMDLRPSSPLPTAFRWLVLVGRSLPLSPSPQEEPFRVPNIVASPVNAPARMSLPSPPLPSSALPVVLFLNLLRLHPSFVPSPPHLGLFPSSPLFLGVPNRPADERGRTYIPTPE